MMMLAPISLVTADQMCCWFTAGHDDARPDRPPVLSQGHRSSLQDRSPHNGSPSKRMSVLDYSSAAGFTRPTLDRRCQRNPHSAR
jgi:hypothetical protein